MTDHQSADLTEILKRLTKLENVQKKLVSEAYEHRRRVDRLIHDPKGTASYLASWSYMDLKEHTEDGLSSAEREGIKLQPARSTASFDARFRSLDDQLKAVFRSRVQEQSDRRAKQESFISAEDVEWLKGQTEWLVSRHYNEDASIEGLGTREGARDKIGLRVETIISATVSAMREAGAEPVFYTVHEADAIIRQRHDRGDYSLPIPGRNHGCNDFAGLNPFRLRRNPEPPLGPGDRV